MLQYLILNSNNFCSAFKELVCEKNDLKSGTSTLQLAPKLNLGCSTNYSSLSFSRGSLHIAIHPSTVSKKPDINLFFFSDPQAAACTW